MEEIAILKNMLPHGIGVVAVIIVVRYFLANQRTESAENRIERASRDKLFVDSIASRDKLFTDTVATIHAENLEARAVGRDAIKENTAATNRVSEKLEAFAKLRP